MAGFYNCEYTDTFGGGPNNNLARRKSFPSEGLSNLQIMRRAKALFGLSGMRGATSTYGDGFEFKPYGSCTVLFVQWSDNSYEGE